MTFNEWESEMRRRNISILKGYQLFAEAVQNEDGEENGD